MSKRRQTYQPEARLFAGVFPKVIRLNVLIWFPPPSRKNTNRILKALPWDAAITNPVNEFNGLFSGFAACFSGESSRLNPLMITDFRVSLEVWLFVSPFRRACHECACGEEYPDVPVSVENRQHVALQMFSARFAGQQVARPCVMAESGKGVPDTS
jgi:hypothetical protein